MFEAIKHPYLVPFNQKFKVSKAPTSPPRDSPSKKDLKKRLDEIIEEIADLQKMFYAHGKRALLLVFQAMDAAGKDGTIRAVMSGIDPAGCQVFSFKQPSSEELVHDFLWRTTRCLPERGRIGIFNRSYYEEVLVVRVHPEFLQSQNLPPDTNLRIIWDQRLQSIRDHEQHLARNDSVILKFWLNVSREEQRLRFLSRLEEPEKHWKFSSADIRERMLWPKYMDVYEKALRETSRSWAPWYAIPADSKSFMRVCVAEIILKTLKSLEIQYPKISQAEKDRFDEMQKILEEDT